VLETFDEPTILYPLKIYFLYLFICFIYSFLKSNKKKKISVKQSEIKYNNLVIVAYLNIKIHNTINNVICIILNKYKNNKIFFADKMRFFIKILL
jgi:hypothetical protein